MKKPKLTIFSSLAFLLASAVSGNCALIYLQNFPVNPVLSYQVQNRLNRLLRYLNYNQQKINKQQLYDRVKTCEVYLEEFARHLLLRYCNTVQGSSNSVLGKNNIVLGDQNTLQGNKNWVFTKNFNGTSDRMLVIDKWKINLDKMELIKVDPKKAIVKWQP